MPAQQRDDLRAIDAFHAHLDVCKRCANEPFNLCAIGEALMLAAVEHIPTHP